MKNNEIENMGKSIFSGFMWLFSGSGTQAILQFVVMIILARVLTPNEFGIMGTAQVIISFATIVSMIGIGPAIVQKKVLNDTDIITGYTLSILFNVLIFFMIFLTAPIFASFFKVDELVKVLEVLSFNFLFVGFATVAESLMQRHMKFKLMAKVQVYSYLIYSIIAIVLSLMNLGYWSLIFAFSAQMIFKSIIIICLQPHKKSIYINMNSTKTLLFFGGGFSLARIFNHIALQGDNLVIGRTLGTESLGLYGRAYQLIVMPANLFGMVLDKVLFPTMAKIQDNNEKLIEVYRKGINLVSVLSLPVGILIVILAKDIILFLFGANWIQIKFPLQILAVGILFRTSYKISDSVVRAKGAVYRRAWRQFIYAVAVLLGSYIGHFWGLEGVSTGILLAIVTNYVLMADLSIKLIRSTWKDFLSAHLMSIKVSLIFLILAFFIKRLISYGEFSSFINLSVTSISTLFCTLFIITLFPKFIMGRDNQWIINLIYSKFSNLKRKVTKNRVLNNEKKYKR